MGQGKMKDWKEGVRIKGEEERKERIRETGKLLKC